MEEAMLIFYDTNEDFRDYVDKYRVKHGIEMPQDAMKQSIVKDAYKYYLDIFERRVVK